MDQLESSSLLVKTNNANIESLHTNDYVSQDKNFILDSHENASTNEQNKDVNGIIDTCENINEANYPKMSNSPNKVVNIVNDPMIVNEKQCSEENLLRNELDPSINNTSPIGIRRNSLPENKINSNLLMENELKNTSVNDLKSCTLEFNSLNEPLTSAKVKKKQVELKHITGVVKNVHGLFSMVGGSLKSAYKPVEKNIGEIMSATQKNLSSVKYDYLKSDKNVLNSTVSQSLNKYSTLNLSNEIEESDELFKKCENFSMNETKIVFKKDHLNGHFSDYKSTPTQATPLDNENSLKSYQNDRKSSLDCGVNNDKSKDNESIKSLPITFEKVDTQFSVSKSIEYLPTSNKTNSMSEVNSLDSHKSSDHSQEKTEILELAINELHKEMSTLKTALIDKDAIKKSLESRVNLLMKQLETVTAERDASVVRYAVSERSILEAIKSKEAAVSAEQSARREVSMIGQRLKIANADKTRASAALDMKCHELSVSQREASRIKDELLACELKLKWAQSKLVSEVESNKETSALVEKLSFQIKQFENGTCNSVAQPVLTADIESQLREKDASIILERHEKEKFETRSKQLQTELDKMKNILNSNLEEMRELRAQVEAGTAEAAALRRTCSELREQGAKDCERLATAQARAARCDTLAVHLQQEQDKSAKLVQELEAMKTLREEILAEGELKARREAELLRQAERLTAVGVKLQATCSEAEAKALALTVDNASLRDAAAKATSEVAEARLELSKEREGRASDARALASRAAQHARGEREALNALEAARGEARVNATKHASAMKELKRELLQLRKRYEKLEVEGKLHSQHQTQMSSDRTGSCSSLSSYEGICQQNHNAESNDMLQDIQVNTPDRQQLVERIVSLQRAAARRGEKLDFLEEHNRQLTQELQKKTRLLRSFLVTVPSGSLASPASDAVKVEIGKHGGVMASVYGSQVTDETMTLELSLEINAKLQNLLEDTLLSNITLKENMDTLGDEITRLKEARHMKK